MLYTEHGELEAAGPRLAAFLQVIGLECRWAIGAYPSTDIDTPLAQLESTSMDETYLTVAEVAELLRLNPQTIRNMIDRGELPAVRVGARRVRVRQSDLDAFLRDEANKADADATLFRVSISDHDAAEPGLGVERAPAVWSYEVEAPSADKAVTIAIGRWRKEVGRKPVSRWITVASA